jgi:hypothetical protein
MFSEDDFGIEVNLLIIPPSSRPRTLHGTLMMTIEQRDELPSEISAFCGQVER